MKINMIASKSAFGIFSLIVQYANASSTKARFLKGEHGDPKEAELPAEVLVLLEEQIAARSTKMKNLPAELLVLLEKEHGIAAAGTTKADEKTDASAVPADVPLDHQDGGDGVLPLYLTDYPTWSPTTFPTLYPTVSSAPSPFCDDGMNIEVKIKNLIWADETSWEVRRFPEGTVVMSGGPYYDNYYIPMIRDEKCVPFGTYIFTINDTYGDGLGLGYYFFGYYWDPIGKYEVKVDNVAKFSGGNTPFSYETKFIWNNKPSSKASKSGGGYTHLEGGAVAGLSMPFESLSM